MTEQMMFYVFLGYVVCFFVGFYLGFEVKGNWENIKKRLKRLF